MPPKPGRPRKPGGPSDTRISSRTAETLTEADKVYRDAFCREYIKDFNGRMAVIRLGCENYNTAKQKACHLLREPYVAQRLDALIRQLQPTDIVTRSQVMAGMWKEANDPYNGGMVRVSALSHVAKMLGMDKPEVEEKAQLTGVMFVPLVSSSDWEAMATVAQQKLKEQAKT